MKMTADVKARLAAITAEIDAMMTAKQGMHNVLVGGFHGAKVTYEPKYALPFKYHGVYFGMMQRTEVRAFETIDALEEFAKGYHAMQATADEERKCMEMDHSMSMRLGTWAAEIKVVKTTLGQPRQFALRIRLNDNKLERVFDNLRDLTLAYEYTMRYHPSRRFVSYHPSEQMPYSLDLDLVTMREIMYPYVKPHPGYQYDEYGDIVIEVYDGRNDVWKRSENHAAKTYDAAMKYIKRSPNAFRLVLNPEVADA